MHYKMKAWGNRLRIWLQHEFVHIQTIVFWLTSLVELSVLSHTLSNRWLAGLSDENQTLKNKITIDFIKLLLSYKQVAMSQD